MLSLRVVQGQSCGADAEVASRGFNATCDSTCLVAQEAVDRANRRITPLEALLASMKTEADDARVRLAELDDESVDKQQGRHNVAAAEQKIIAFERDIEILREMAEAEVKAALES